MIKHLPIFVMIISLTLTFYAIAQEDLLIDLKKELRDDYSDVTHITIDEYLANHNESLLVDVRAIEEFEVSRIPGAVHAADENALVKLAKLHEDKELVLYCSVGQRSSVAARFLQDSGYDNVVNLEGSIFEWANREKSMQNSDGDTQKVHPYNLFWGWRYLTEDARSH